MLIFHCTRPIERGCFWDWNLHVRAESIILRHLPREESYGRVHRFHGMLRLLSHTYPCFLSVFVAVSGGHSWAAVLNRYSGDAEDESHGHQQHSGRQQGCDFPRGCRSQSCLLHSEPRRQFGSFDQFRSVFTKRYQHLINAFGVDTYARVSSFEDATHSHVQIHCWIRV